MEGELMSWFYFSSPGLPLSLFPLPLKSFSLLFLSLNYVIKTISQSYIITLMALSLLSMLFLLNVFPHLQVLTTAKRLLVASFFSLMLSFLVALLELETKFSVQVMEDVLIQVIGYL